MKYRVHTTQDGTTHIMHGSVVVATMSDEAVPDEAARIVQAMNPCDTPDSRARFEQWAVEYYGGDLVQLGRWGDIYSKEEMQEHWIGWQAALSQESKT